MISEEKCSEEKGEGGSAYMQIRSEIGQLCYVYRSEVWGNGAVGIGKEFSLK